ncbi:lysosomal alpha-glucosidase-like [Bacillus rossius redtenbacheri]|uniref:lysosomal alpha-glucosidase-like n=1 Tax=Bacillus rossius redtenbacheri TaxID=93214 RepID=UPI002FDE2C2B
MFRLAAWAVVVLAAVGASPGGRVENVLEEPSGRAENILEAPRADQCTGFANSLRFDCYPEDDASEEKCQNRGCCWRSPDTSSTASERVALNIPYCFYPQNYGGYKFLNISDAAFGKTAYLQRGTKSYIPNDISIIRIDAKFESQSRLHVRIYDPSKERWIPPLPEMPQVDTKATNTDYDFVIEESKIGFKVSRKDDSEVLFNTQDLGGLIYADQFIQMSTLLPTNYIYGLGEHRAHFPLSTTWQRFTTWNRDIAPSEYTNLYGTHPFYLAMETSGKSHGVLMFNSNGMDVLLQPTPALTYRTVGGIIDLYFFLGPSPSDVVKQYTELVGRPFLPPYWGLGFHLCRYGYKTLTETKAAMSRTQQAGIPLDTMWNDLDYMKDQNDFTYDTSTFAGLPEFVDQLHTDGMHYIPLIDPGISASEASGTYPPYDRGVELGVFVKDSAGKPFLGKVWNPQSTAFPDFTNPKALDYWKEMLTTMYKLFKFDGAWIDMNEPANFLDGSTTGCDKNSLNSPPYTPAVAGGALISRTLCMDAQQHMGKHYDVHNMYGFTETIVTATVLSEIRQKRPFVISRSTFIGHGHYSGHWSGDISSSWSDMAWTIPELLSMSVFGVSLMGADICGFNGGASATLCQRWMELGAFYPFSRNHNTKDVNAQDPASFGTEVAESSRKALLTRYSLLPYLYTLLWAAHAEGSTVVTPLFFEFPSDKDSYAVDTAFMWGSGLLIVPVLTEGSTEVTVYLPKAQWYSFYTGALLSPGGANTTLSAPLDTIPLLVRGGAVLPMQTPATTTTAARKNKFGLMVAADPSGAATGSLYWDDGDTLGTYEQGAYNLITFTLRDSQLTGTPTHTGYTGESMVLGNITVLGVSSASSVSVNGASAPFTFDSSNKVLKMDSLSVSLTDAFTIKWS